MKITPFDQWALKKQNNGEFKRPFVIAGPCSAETPEQVLEAAKLLAATQKIDAFRAGVWKPRTRPNNFEGVGQVALPWLAEVKRQYNLPLSIEVATPEHVELALKYEIDYLWVGARTTANPFSVQALADALKGSDVPVFIKNPVNADLALWVGAIERFNNAGLTKLVAVHRGFSRSEKSPYRNPPMWQIPMELKRLYPELPILCDPSHITGNRDNVARVCQKALDLNMDGVMVETHPEPEKAWSDAAQQVTPAQLENILNNISLRQTKSNSSSFEQEMSLLRDNIDRIDLDLIELLKTRHEVVEKIAQVKYQNNVTPLQVNRLDEIIRKRQTWGEEHGLGVRFMKELFDIIHEESVRTQTNIMNHFESLDDKESDNGQK